MALSVEVGCGWASFGGAAKGGGNGGGPPVGGGGSSAGGSRDMDESSGFGTGPPLLAAMPPDLDESLGFGTELTEPKRHFAARSPDVDES